MKLPIALLVFMCLLQLSFCDDERWVWPSDAKKPPPRGGRSILNDVDPRVLSGGKSAGRMIFPEDARYGEPYSSSIKFQSSEETVETNRHAKRLEFESSANSLRKPAVVGRVRNFPHGGGYAPESPVENQPPSAPQNLPAPDQGLDTSEWLKQHSYSRGSSAADQITQYNSASQEQQGQNVVASLGHEYLNPGSLEDDSSLESVYYTGSGGAYDHNPQLPYYIQANPDYTYGGGHKEGYQYQLVDENQQPQEGFDHQQGTPLVWDYQEAQSAYSKAAQQLGDPSYSSSSSYTRVHAGQPLSFDTTDGKNCEDCSEGWEPLPYDILSVNSGEQRPYYHEQHVDHQQHQQHLQESQEILQGLYPRVITVPAHINIIPEPYFVDTDAFKNSRRQYGRTGRKLTGPAPVYHPPSVYPPPQEDQNTADLPPFVLESPTNAEDKQITVQEVQPEVPVVKLRDDSEPEQPEVEPTSTSTSVVVSSDQEGSIINLRSSLPKTDFANFRDTKENVSTTTEKATGLFPRRNIYRRKLSPVASAPATTENTPFVAPVTVDGYIAQGSQYNVERVPAGSTEADRVEQPEDVRIVSFIPPGTDYNGDGSGDTGADATLKRSVATVSHGNNGKVFLQSKTIKLECEIPFCIKGVLKWTLYPNTANQISARSSDAAPKNGIELEEDDVSKRRPGTAKKSVLYLGENPAITEAQARSFDSSQSAHSVTPGVYQCEVIKCGESDYSPVESFLIK